MSASWPFAGRVVGLHPYATTGASATWDPTRDPALSSGLILDLCPDYMTTVTLNGSNVSAISDRSGSGNNYYQPTAGSQPPLTASDSTAGGRATIAFTNNTHKIISVAKMPALSTLTCAVFWKKSASNGVSIFGSAAFGLAGAWDIRDTNSSYFKDGSNYATRAVSSPAGGAWTRSQAQIDAGNSPFQLVREDNDGANGTVTNTGAPTAGSIVTNWWQICGGGTVGIVLTVGRICVWNRFLSASEQTAVDTGLRSFFRQ